MGESCYLIPVEIVYDRWWSGFTASNRFSFLRVRCNPEGGYERSHAASRHDGDCPADGPPRLPRLSSLRRLLCLPFQFSTVYRSSWSLRPIGAPLVSLREAQLGPVWLKETAYEFRP